MSETEVYHGFFQRASELVECHNDHTTSAIKLSGWMKYAMRLVSRRDNVFFANPARYPEQQEMREIPYHLTSSPS
jgi:hypothetical protein